MIVGFGLIFAFSMDGVVSGLKSWLKFGAPLGIGFWAGLFWRRFNAAGVWVSTLTAYFCWWMTTQSFFISFLLGCDSLLAISSKVKIIKKLLLLNNS